MLTSPDATLPPRHLGSLVGSYQSQSVPVWVEWFMRLPWLRSRLARRAVSEIQIYDQGIRLNRRGGDEATRSQILRWQEIRRVWFERYRTGSEQPSHTSFRIDLIADNLDTLFSLRKADCPASDPDLKLMEHLYLIWREATWRHYHVVAAIVTLSAGQAGRTDLSSDTPVFLCMQKGQTRYAYTSYHWEFPGGKVEEGESEAEALRRELREEMDYDVCVVRHLTTVEHRYPDFGLSLSCHLCKAETAVFTRREHHDHRWLTAAEMSSLEWCAADAPVISLLSEDILTHTTHNQGSAPQL